MSTRSVGLFKWRFCIVTLLAGTAVGETSSFSNIADVFNADLKRDLSERSQVESLCDITLFLTSIDPWISQAVGYS